jgi:hypothetical protein
MPLEQLDQTRYFQQLLQLVVVAVEHLLLMEKMAAQVAALEGQITIPELGLQIKATTAAGLLHQR